MPAKFDKLQISRIGPDLHYMQTRSAGYIQTTDSGYYRYFHIKTNVGGDDSMWLADIVGYNYGNAKAIRTSLSWYAYQNNIYNVAGSSVSNSGLDPINVYAASDWSSVLVFLGDSVYYSGFTLNLYNTRQDTSAQLNPSITTWTLTSSSSPVY